jgi:hypothetical protein
LLSCPCAFLGGLLLLLFVLVLFRCAGITEARDEHVEEAERLIGERRLRLLGIARRADGILGSVRRAARDGADARQRGREAPVSTGTPTDTPLT